MKGKKKYEGKCLKKPYLVVTHCTAFQMKYLYEIVLNCFYRSTKYALKHQFKAYFSSNASFSGLAAIYNNLHFDCLSEELSNKRWEILDKWNFIYRIKFDIGVKYTRNGLRRDTFFIHIWSCVRLIGKF